MRLQAHHCQMLLLMCATVALVTGSAWAASPLTDSTDVMIVNREEKESSIFVSPLDPKVVLVSNNGGGSVTGWISMDRGASWDSSSSDVGPGDSDPACVISKAAGTYGRFLVNHIGENGGQAISYKNSPGASWTPDTVYVVGQGNPTDKNHLWVDNKSTGDHAENLYCGWTTPDGIHIARSTTDGVSWDDPVDIDHLSLGGIAERWSVNITSDSDGNVYAVWANNQSSANNVAKSLGFSSSNTGGATWATEDTIRTDLIGFGVTTNKLLGDKEMLVTTYPSMAVDWTTDHIYVAWASHVTSGGESDIYMIKSTDGGSTWSPKKRVNQDTLGNGKDQWFPWITWDECSGALAVTYLDSRTSNDSAWTYVSVSTDTSATWQDIRVSDAAWAPDLGSTPAGYDYIGVAAGDGYTYPVWSDDHTGNMRPYMSRISLWGVEQGTASASYDNGFDDVIDVSVTWSTNIAAEDGDQVVLTSPVSGTHTTYTSTLCDTCSSNGGKNHSVTFTDLPCELGYWTYTVKSSRASCSTARYSEAKTVKVEYCLE